MMLLRRGHAELSCRVCAHNKGNFLIPVVRILLFSFPCGGYTFSGVIVSESLHILWALASTGNFGGDMV